MQSRSRTHTLTHTQAHWPGNQLTLEIWCLELEVNRWFRKFHSKWQTIAEWKLLEKCIREQMNVFVENYQRHSISKEKTQHKNTQRTWSTPRITYTHLGTLATTNKNNSAATKAARLYSNAIGNDSGKEIAILMVLMVKLHVLHFLVCQWNVRGERATSDRTEEKSWRIEANFTWLFTMAWHFLNSLRISRAFIIIINLILSPKCMCARSRRKTQKSKIRMKESVTCT